jgi:DNA-binding MarR family transcriptional regulator/GNAT superfamily N-acetyltransferase
VAQVRAFNRFYTNVIGVLQEHLLHSPYSLTEVRVMYELANRGPTHLVALRRDLGVDAGYLSRIVARFESEGLATRRRSSEDGRHQILALTAAGRKLFKKLDQRSADEVGTLLTRLGEDEQRRLVGAMGAIRSLLNGSPADAGALVLRAPRPGDLGWVVARNGALYAQEHGFNDNYEALVARIVADYAAQHDPRREAAWIAEIDGEPVGSVFCVQRDDDTAQLRLLLVDPSARGRGVGSRLVDECLRFARQAGYKRMVLWTNDVLAAARRIYERAGFELIGEEPHTDFGQATHSQTWARDL